MAWEHADLIFPLGMTVLPDGQIISNKDLQHSKIETLTHTTSFNARQMLTNTVTDVWGKDGEYARIINYDIFNILPRPDAEHSPLNAYGLRMLRDYMYLHDIELDT